MITLSILSSRVNKISFLPLLFLTLAMLACSVGEQSLGVLKIDDQPVTFTMYAEVINSWQAKVSPAVKYVVVLERQKSPILVNESSVHIVVWEKGKDIVTSRSFSENVGKAEFTVQEDTEVFIQVYPLTGENPQNLGTFTIYLKKG